MTPTGAMILGIYSLIVTIALVVKDFIEMVKGESNGWTLILLILVVIYLVNVI